MTNVRNCATVAAVDLGASSGRVILGRVGDGRIDLHEMSRFPNSPISVAGTFHWDILRLYQGILEGLSAIAHDPNQERPASIGVDSWGVDYGLLDAGGQLLGNPISYRDSRTDGIMERVLAEGNGPEIYQRTGIQFLTFNTIFQLLAAKGSPQLETAKHLLLIPDLINYWLTGSIGIEYTNASTTQLINLAARNWDFDLLQKLGLPRGLLPELRQPGDLVGPLTSGIQTTTGLGPVPVVAVGSHDTASAVVGVPAINKNFAYISCGTWSLVGVETDRPVVTEEGRLAGFTNEAGVDGTIRYLRNIMGFWLLQESMRTWQNDGQKLDTDELVSAAGELPPLTALIDPENPVFMPPGDMPSRIAAVCQETGQPVPDNPVAMTRCVLDSLALAHRRAIRDAQRLTGKEVEVVHIVGGGSRNRVLCQLTADACGLPVIAGPTEATALGNVLLQARTLGVVGPDLAALRALLHQTCQLREYQPRGKTADWDQAEARIYRTS